MGGDECCIRSSPRLQRPICKFPAVLEAIRQVERGSQSALRTLTVLDLCLTEAASHAEQHSACTHKQEWLTWSVCRMLPVRVSSRPTLESYRENTSRDRSPQAAQSLSLLPGSPVHIQQVVRGACRAASLQG